MNEINKDLFSRKLLDDYNSFFEIKKITLNGRSKSNLDSIKKVKFLGKSKKIAATLIAEIEGK